MQRNNGDMIIYSSTYASFESAATVEPRQRISNIYIYLYVSEQSVFIGSEILRSGETAFCQSWRIMWLKRNPSSHENNVNSRAPPVYRELIPMKFTIVKKIPVWKIRPSGRITKIKNCYT